MLAVPAGAHAAQQVIASAGPLESIFLNDNLGCQVQYTGDTSNEFFGGTNPGACGTYLATGGTVYGPQVPADGNTRTAFTLVGQSAVTGTGTAADPFQVVTVVDAGSTGLRLIQTDSYVVGQETYRTNVAVQNTTGSPVSAALYHAGDCFLQNDDTGFGWFDSDRSGIYCSRTANNSPADRIVGFVPVASPGSSYIEAGFSTVWAAINGNQFGNTCLCTTVLDNGAGLSWALSVSAGSTVSRELLTAFSPAGEVPDSDPPDVTLASPADDTRTADATPTFSGAAGTEATDLDEVTVSIYAGATATGEPLQEQTTTQSGGSWSVAASPALAAGTYTAQAEQSDGAGNVGQSSTSTFTVDLAAPAVTLTDPADGLITSNVTPEFAGTAGEATGDLGDVTVRIYSGSTATGAPVRTLTASEDGGAWSVTPEAALPEGVYTAQAEQSDDVGHVGKSAAHTFTVSTEAPAVTLTAPANGSVTNNATPTLSGAAGTAPGDATLVTVQIYAGTSAAGTPVQTLTVARDGGTWSAAPSPLAEGTYTAQAEQLDSADNLGQSGTRSFTIDTTVPVVTLDAPAAGAATEDTTPTLSGEAGQAARDSATVRLRIYAGESTSDTPLQTLEATRDGGTWSVTPETLEPGAYTARADQGDAAGNNGQSDARTFTVIVVADTTDGSETLPPPVLGKQVNLQPLGKGPVYISLPGSTTGAATAARAHTSKYKAPVKRRIFIRLRAGIQIPVGSLVDVRRGRVLLTTATNSTGGVQSSRFFKGSFKIKQSRRKSKKGQTTLTLIGGDFNGCKTGGKSASHSNGAPVAETARRRRRRLWGRGRGRFRTRGRRGAATVRGTTWFVEDRCGGTFFKVKKGKVRIRDFSKHKWVTLRAGDTYFAAEKP